MQNIIAADVHTKIWNLSYKLFKDEGSLPCTFVQADILDIGNEKWKPVLGNMDIVYASYFFHLWDLEMQSVVFKAVASLLRPVDGSVVFGIMLGGEIARYEDFIGTERRMFCHNKASLQELCDRIGKETGQHFVADAKLEHLQEHIKVGPLTNANYRLLYFSITLKI